MIGQLIKLIILVVVIMIGLKMFAPNTYDSILGTVSDKTGIEKSKMDDSLDNIKDKATEGMNVIKEKTGEAIQEIKENAK